VVETVELVLEVEVDETVEEVEVKEVVADVELEVERLVEVDEDESVEVEVVEVDEEPDQRVAPDNTAPVFPPTMKESEGIEGF
jgi:hypothetical protein